MWILLHFMLSKMFIKLSSFFKILFSFCCPAWVFFLPCPLKHWFYPLLELTYCLFFPVYDLSHILHSLFLILWFLFSSYKSFAFFYFWLVLFYGFCVFFHAVEYPYNHYSKLSDKLLAPIYVVLENSLVLSFGVSFSPHFGCFFVFSFLDVKQTSCQTDQLLI